MILSRVKVLSQLFIIDSICPEKIWASVNALEELKRLNSIAINNDPSPACIISCNIRSLSKHYEDLITSSYVKNAKVICLQETWLDINVEQDSHLEIKDMHHHFVKVGAGKGIATYWKDDFCLCSEIKNSNIK